MAAGRARASPSSGCPTRWCASRSTGSRGRGRERRRAVPAAADHHRALAGVDAQAGQRLRPRAGRRGAGRRRRGARRSRSTGWCCSASSGSTARCGPSAACCPPCWPRRGPVTRRSSCPAANADEAALVEGVEVLAAGDARPSVVAHLAGRRPLAAHGARPAARPPPRARPRRRRRAGRRAAGGRGRRRRRSPPVPRRPARGRARRCSPSGCPGCCPPLDEQAALEVTAIHSVAGTLPPGAPLVTRPTVRGAAPLGDHGRAGRRRLGADPPGCALPGAPRASCSWTRRPSSRGRCSTRCASRWSAAQVTIHRAARVGHLPVPGAAGAGRQPVPLRQRRRRHRLHVQPAGAAALPVPAVRARCSTASTCGSTCPPVTRAAWLDGLGAPESTAVVARRVAAGAGGGGGAAGRAPGCAVNSQVPGRLLRERWAVPRRVAAAGRAGAGARRAVGPRVRPGAAGRVDPGRPRRPDRARAPTRWPRPSACGCSGPRHDRLDEDLEDAAVGGGAGQPGSAPGPGLAEPRRASRARSTSGATSRTSARWRRCAGCARARRRSAIRSLVGARAEQDATLADLRGPSAAAPGWSTPEDDEWPALPLHALTLAVSGEPDEPTAPVRPDARRRCPPLALWVRGPARLDELVDRSVAVVGSRASTAYGEHVAAELGHQLGERGWTVVSGGAFGIDAAAHRGALAAGGADRRGAGLRGRPALPGRARRAVPPHRRDGSAGQRVAAGLRAAAAPVPRAQPADRRADPRHGGGRGGRPVRRAGHGPPGAGPRPAGAGRARTGHVGDERGLPRAAARRGARAPAGRLGGARHRGGRAASATTSPTPGRGPPSPRDGLSDVAAPGARRLPGADRGEPGAAGRASPAATSSTCCACCPPSSWPTWCSGPAPAGGWPRDPGPRCQVPAMTTPRETAEAFSGHRFRDAYAALSPTSAGPRSARGSSPGGSPSSTRARPR